MKNRGTVLVLRSLLEAPGASQRKLAEMSGLSLGSVNNILKKARENNWIIGDINKPLTVGGMAFLSPYKVDNAILLAAGFGSRCVPLTYETPKGLLKVHGQPMIERQIEQLKEKGINEIIVVVGYMKEKFDYLIDKYQVKLVYNPEYATKNNLASLYCASKHLKRSYVLVADNWMESNIFNAYEPYSWFSCLYMAGETAEWVATFTPSGRIEKIAIGGIDDWAILGPAFFSADFAKTFYQYLMVYYQKPGTEDFYWEHILKENIDKLPMYKNDQTGNVHEFESLEELRLYDTSYIQESHNRIMSFIADYLHVKESEIHHILPLKEGVTNDSFRFETRGQAYVFRRSGVRAGKLVDRTREKAAYEAMSGADIIDKVLVLNTENGDKLSYFIEGARLSDPTSDADLAVCMQAIKEVHQSGRKTTYSYDPCKMAGRMIDLAQQNNAIRFSDIDDSLKKFSALCERIDKLQIPSVLCHGDFVHSNVLIMADKGVRIIDWEYGGMCDPILDIANYGINAGFDRKRLELSLEFYLLRPASREELERLYLYAAVCGMIWSMWSQYIQSQGQEFGEYPLKMYRYFKDYYNILVEEG